MISLAFKLPCITKVELLTLARVPKGWLSVPRVPKFIAAYAEFVTIISVCSSFCNCINIFSGKIGSPA